MKLTRLSRRIWNRKYNFVRRLIFPPHFQTYEISEQAKREAQSFSIYECFSDFGRWLRHCQNQGYPEGRSSPFLFRGVFCTKQIISSCSMVSQCIVKNIRRMTHFQQLFLNKICILSCYENLISGTWSQTGHHSNFTIET